MLARLDYRHDSQVGTFSTVARTQQQIGAAELQILQLEFSIKEEVTKLLQDTQNTLRELQERLGLGMVFVTHDLSVASGFCQRVIVLDGGRIVEEGPGRQLLAAPQAGITRTLVAACPRLP